MTTTSGENPIGKCPYCDMMHTGICWKVAAIEYHPDGSTKRVEFHGPPQLGGSVENKPLPGVSNMLGEAIAPTGQTVINALVPPPGPETTEGESYPISDMRLGDAPIEEIIASDIAKGGSISESISRAFGHRNGPHRPWSPFRHVPREV